MLKAHLSTDLPSTEKPKSVAQIEEALQAVLEQLSPAEMTALVLSGSEALSRLCPPVPEEEAVYSSFPPASERKPFDAKEFFRGTS